MILTIVWNNINTYERKTWVSNLKYHMMDIHNNEQMFMLGYIIMASLLGHHWIGRVRGESTQGRIVVITAMFLGFMLHMLILNGQLTAIYLKIFRKQHDYTKKLNVAKKFFSEWQMDYSKTSKIHIYYKQLWNNRDGIRFMPRAFKLLPLSLQKQVCLDIFWEALQHSHIFNIMDIPFKREISLIMRSDCLLTGDYLFKTDEIKHKMIYIVCGVVEILSKQDRNSSILSFSNGTILGEMASLIPMQSCCNVRCATYCEYYVIELTDLYRSLILYRSRTRILQNNFFKRVENARQMHNIKIASLRLVEISAQEMTIRKLKRQWRQMIHINIRAKKNSYKSFSTRVTDSSFCSKYLDLLVLSDPGDLKHKAICINGSWPCIMYPKSSVKTFVNYCLLGAIVYQCFMVPYLAANFNTKQLHKDHLGQFIILDIIYMVDIYLQAITAISVRNNMVQNSAAIIMYRSKQVSFLIDLVATLPLDYIGYACKFDHNVISILRAPKVLRVYRLIQYAKMKERILTIYMFFIRFIKFIVIYVLVIYGYNCLFTRFTCDGDNCYAYGWLAYGKKILKHNVNISKATDKFFIGLHYTTSIILALGNNNFFPYSMFDMVTYCLAMYTGYNILDIILYIKLSNFILPLYPNMITLYLRYYIFSFMISQLTATYVHSLNTQHQYNETIRLLHLFFQTSLVPHYIRVKAYEFFNFLYHYNSNAIPWGPNNVFNKAPEMEEIVSNMLKAHIRNIPLFETLHEKTISKITQLSHLYVFPPNTTISTANYKEIWVYIIIRGHCNMYSTVPGDADCGIKRILTCGDIFPLLELLHMINTYITVTTLTAMEAIMIPYMDLLPLLQFDMDNYNNIENALRIHRNDFEGIINRRMGFLESQVLASMPIIRPDKGNSFSYKINDDVKFENIDGIVKSNKAFLKPFQKLGKMGYIVQCFLMNSTINPRTKMFICWEIFRWHIAFSETVLCLLQLNVLLNYVSAIEIFGHCNFCSCLLDFYIRMHCQYYTSQGILVTHPLKTCMHYLSTSFTIDFIAAFPICYIGLDTAFFGNRKFELSRILRFLHIFQLHRMISGLKYFIKEATHAGAVAIRALITMLIILIILTVLANVLSLATCELTVDKKNFNCFLNPINGRKKWIRDFAFVNQLNNSGISVALASIYTIVSTITGSLAGIGSAKSVSDAILILPGMLFLFFMRVILLVTTGAMQIGGNAAITKNAFKLKHFLNYSKFETVDELLVNEFVKYSEYRWKKAGGDEFHKSFKKLNQVIIHEVRAFVYMDSIGNSFFFNNMISTYLYSVCYYIRRTSLKKDAMIIRCNDINENLYFVHKGYVDVSIAGINVASLTKGGCIGCMNKKGSIRHTITVQAMVHTELLYIKTMILSRLSQENSLLYTRINEADLLNYEYVKSFDRKSSFMWSKANIRSKYYGDESRISFYFSHFNKVINQESSWYAAYNYILNVHIAPISGLLILFFSFFIYNRHFILPALYVTWTVDVLFWMRLFINVQLSYIDPESGFTVTQPNKILKRRIKSYRFALDLLVNFPYEVLLYYCGVSMNILKYTVLMRILRIAYLVEYYYTCKRALNVSILLRATGLMYTILMQLTFVSLLWWYTACEIGVCSYIEKPGFTNRNMNYTVTNDTLESILLSLTYTVNLFTATGLRDVVPTSKNDIFVSLIISVWGVLSISLFCAAFISMLVINSVTFCDYEYKIEKLRTYLKYRELSPILVDKVWWYLLELWSRHQGAHSSELIQEMPKYLQQDFMYSIYGKYLEKHHLFSNTHVDFLRQLVTSMKGCMYLPGYSIVEAGDITDCMYFIHKGEVEEFENVFYEETVTRVYGQGMSFGEVQGLFTVPYTKSYRALSVVNLISLKKDDWISMLKWFPATKEQILQQVHRGKYEIDYYAGVDFTKLY